jgi:hypothetical protein
MVITPQIDAMQPEKKETQMFTKKAIVIATMLIFAAPISAFAGTAGRVDMAAIRGDKGATEGVVETAVVGVTVAQVEMVDTEARAAEMVATAAIPNN